MKTDRKLVLAWLVVVQLCVTFGCSRKQKSQQPEQIAAPHEEAHEEEIKAATPEDPGPIATVSGPLAVWMRKADQAKAAREAAYRHSPQPVDHVTQSAEEQPQNFVHKAFSVKTYVQFDFVVPPHQSNPRLKGNFQSFIRPDTGYVTGKEADIDLLLLNAAEFDDFSHGRPGNATYKVETCHNQVVDYAIAPTYDQPREYHLVFYNSAGDRARFIGADFTVSFE